MSKPIKLAIITARNLRTSSGSNNTVVNLLNNLDSAKYQVTILLIDDLVPTHLIISEKQLQKDITYIPFTKISNNPKVNCCHLLSQLTLKQLKNKFDMAIVAIYNYFGEDGKLLGLLDTVNIPYLSPELKTSTLCFDKSLTKSIFKAHELLTPPAIEIHQNNYDFSQTKALVGLKIKYPCMVKTNSCGASRGVFLVSRPSQLKNAINKAFAFSPDVLIEIYLKGKEFTVGVIGHYTKPTALPSVMIKSQNQFFDYQAKYLPGKAEEICPAPIDNRLELVLQTTAIKAYQAVKAESHSRIDMIVSDGKVYVLEINTFPGLVASSLFPKELKAAGLSISQFLDKTINCKLIKAQGKTLSF